MDKSTTYCITDKVADEDRVLPPRKENIIITSFEMIRLCTHIKGPLILSNIKNSSKAKLFQVEEVDGCVTVENTQLTSLRFMEKVKITGTCLEGHKIVNNPDLCARRYLVDTGITVTETGNKGTDCRGFLFFIVLKSISLSQGYSLSSPVTSTSAFQE